MTSKQRAMLRSMANTLETILYIGKDGITDATVKEAYDALAVEYVLASQMLAARTTAGLTQEAVASRMGTTKSAISRLESAGKHAPSLATLKRYAEAVGCKLEIKLVRQR